MDKIRKSYTPEFKLKVVLESMQRDTTQEEVCQKEEEGPHDAKDVQVFETISLVTSE